MTSAGGFYLHVNEDKKNSLKKLREAHEKVCPLLSFKRYRLQDLAPSLKKEVAELHRASPSATLDKRFIIFF